MQTDQLIQKLVCEISTTANDIRRQVTEAVAEFHGPNEKEQSCLAVYRIEQELLNSPEAHLMIGIFQRWVAIRLYLPPGSAELGKRIMGIYLNKQPQKCGLYIQTALMSLVIALRLTNHCETINTMKQSLAEFAKRVNLKPKCLEELECDIYKSIKDDRIPKPCCTEGPGLTQLPDERSAKVLLKDLADYIYAFTCEDARKKKFQSCASTDIFQILRLYLSELSNIGVCDAATVDLTLHALSMYIRPAHGIRRYPVITMVMLRIVGEYSSDELTNTWMMCALDAMAGSGEGRSTLHGTIPVAQFNCYEDDILDTLPLWEVPNAYNTNFMRHLFIKTAKTYSRLIDDRKEQCRKQKSRCAGTQVTPGSSKYKPNVCRSTLNYDPCEYVTNRICKDGTNGTHIRDNFAELRKEIDEHLSSKCIPDRFGKPNGIGLQKSGARSGAVSPAPPGAVTPAARSGTTTPVFNTGARTPTKVSLGISPFGTPAASPTEIFNKSTSRESGAKTPILSGLGTPETTSHNTPAKRPSTILQEDFGGNNSYIQYNASSSNTSTESGSESIDGITVTGPPPLQLVTANRSAPLRNSAPRAIPPTHY